MIDPWATDEEIEAAFLLETVAATLAKPAPRGESRAQRLTIAEKSAIHAMVRREALEACAPANGDCPPLGIAIALHGARADEARAQIDLRFV